MTAKIASDFRPIMGKRIAEHMSRYNAAYNPDAPLSDFLEQSAYLNGAEMVLRWAEIPYRFNTTDDGKRYVSVTLEGWTYPVPEEEAP